MGFEFHFDAQETLAVAVSRNEPEWVRKMRAREAEEEALLAERDRDAKKEELEAMD